MGAGTDNGGRALLALDDGSIVVAGVATAGGISVNQLARWNGTSWTGFGGGLNDSALALTRLPDGDVAVGGLFTTAGGLPSRYVARLSTNCPATAVLFGSGCSGSGGTNTLTATALPWVGSAFRASAKGMPPLAFVAVVTGFTQLAIPLSAAVSQALPGCQGLVTADAVDVLLPVAGAVETQLAIPPVAGLAGVVVHQYLVPFELNTSGQVTAITSSNALALTVGVF